MSKISLKLSFLIIIFLVAFSGTLLAQIENYEISGAKTGSIDTVAQQTSQKIVSESIGLLEKEIDPEKYILGPGDILSISIIAAKTKEWEIMISPDGRIMIPDAGVVNLKGLTLSQGEQLIKEKLKKTFKTDEIFIVLRDLRKFKVTVSGAVKKTSIVPATAVDRVSEVIEKAGGFKPDGSLRKIQLYRNGKLINVDLMKFFRLGNDDANPTVLGGDRIVVPNINNLQKLSIRGEVPFPGDYEFNEGDSLSTLIRFGNGFFKSSFLDSVEFVRIGSGTKLQVSILNLTEWDNRLKDGQPLPNDFPLLNGDRVFVRRNPYSNAPYEVIITGEVKLPGKYAVDGETTRVSDIIDKAGGLTSNGSLESSYLLRQAEVGLEDKEMDRLRRTPAGDMSETEYRYFQSRLNEKQGIMAINFPKLMANKNVDDNVVLLNRDSIVISSKKYFVNVQGRVNNPGLVIYKPEFTYLDYIALAGGYGFRSDESGTMIVKSRGQQFDAERGNYHIDPGDYILVPPRQDISWGTIAMTTLTVVAQIVAVVGVVIAVSRTK